MPIPKAMLDREIVTSPTLKPKKACRTDETMSVEVEAPGRQDQERGHQDQDHRGGPGRQDRNLVERALAQPGIGLERGGEARLSLSARPMNVSTLWTSR